MPGELPVDVLIVDDRPEQRLALTVALAELDVNVITVSSGREALRALLQRDFAVILLDVNMPGMDGFETAALIRARARSEHTPIIFVTADSDDAHAMHGYSLGAVDFIFAPVDPKMLRAKVTVFVELFRRTEEVTHYADSLRRHAVQLRLLADASVAIRAGKSVDELLEVVAATAASIIGADHVLAETVVESSPVLGERSGERRVRHVVRLPRDSPLAELSLGRIAGGSGRVVRLTASELARRPEWRSATSAVRSTPLRGFLAAPIIAAEGRITGSIQLAGKRDGEFTSDDEALLEPLARIASIAIENALYSEAQEASRAKDEFLATLSHELRTPLQAMLSWTRLLREEGVDPQMLARGLEVIERSATAQKELIDDLLDVSRMMAQNFRLDLERVSLSKVLGHAVEAARPAAEAKGIDLRPALESRPLIVRGDPQRLQQIFGNLLTNAIKFTPSGGTVEIDLARMDGRARIRVRDTGEGIPGEFIPHLFERFRQADSSSTRAHGGLGIGLAIVRHLVELHAGTVTAESAGVDQGACFTVTLPLAEGLELEEDSAAAEASEEAVVAGRLDGLRLLLLEDEEHTREALALTLRQRGAEVTAVATAADAIAALDRELPDVLISDVAMPGEDGISFIRRLRERSAQRGGSIPATALSAYARPEESARALRAGFDLHLSKPVADDLLVASVRRLAARAGR